GAIVDVVVVAAGLVVAGAIAGVADRVVGDTRNFFATDFTDSRVKQANHEGHDARRGLFS
ncbi:MAG: hypothetical protein WAM48_05145, partial [Candidatus Sulfotelmatobacter sp.]